MTQCPTCKLEMESHSTAELLECCMKQMSNDDEQTTNGVCPNCRHEINKHTDSELVECTLAYLHSN